jgi:pentatricopeptide repeat protein
MKRSKKYEIGAATYTSIIKSYMENKDETSAKMVWDSIDRTKEKVDVHLYTSGIRLHLGLRDTHTVLTLFKEMKEKKILFDEKIYQLYLRTMFVVKAYDKIEPTIQAMRNDPAVTFSHYVYNQIIQGYCLAGMMRESEHYLEEMKHNGLAPDRITFKFLQIGYQIIGDIETAKKMRVELKNLTKGRENQ